MLRWGSDYMDPHSNAADLLHEPGQRRQRHATAPSPGASSWQDKDLTDRAAANVKEQDADKRVREYERMQRDHQERSPFAIMLQQIEVAAMRKGVSGLRDRAAVGPHRLRGHPEGLKRLRSLAATAASVPITLFGLVLITFLIGRVVPIDPVLAVVGDRAPQDVVERTRHEMGLDRPLPEQFVRYTGQLLQGDLGRSVMTSNRVVDRHRPLLPGDARAGDAWR